MGTTLTDRLRGWKDFDTFHRLPPVRLPYWDYLDRRTASQTGSIAAVKRGAKNPSLAFMLPDVAVVPFVADVLTTPDEFAGIWLIEVFPMITARCTQPLQKMPAADLSFGVRLQRRTSAAAMHDPQAMLAANQKLVTRLLASRWQGLSALRSRSDARAMAATLWIDDLATVRRRQKTDLIRTTCSRRAREFSKLRALKSL